jgi:uncharacterized protein YndB with AHSA1/START domain
MSLPVSHSEPLSRPVEVTLVTRATVSRVWEAWTDPVRLVEWFADRAKGTVATGELLTWSFDHPASEMTFRVSPFTSPGRLVLESVAGNPSQLEVLVTPGHDGTRISLTHTGLPGQQSWEQDRHTLASSWQLALSVLRYYVEFHYAEPRRTFFASRIGRFSASRLTTLFREPSGLQEWLTDGGSLGTPGGRVHLALKSGEILRGDMLADTGTDIAMAWDEIGGVLQFRSLAVPQEPHLRLVTAVGWGWGLLSERARQIEADLDAALERLDRAADIEAGQGALQSH